MFKNDSGQWSEVQKVLAPDGGYPDRFGFSVALSAEYAIVGAYGESHDESGGDSTFYAGAAYIFKDDSGRWTQVQKIVGSDRGEYFNFGYTLSISGDYALIGSIWDSKDSVGGNNMQYAGAAYLFKNDSGNWTQVQKLVPSDRDVDDGFGHSLDISKDYAVVGTYREDNDLVGADSLRNSGSVYIFGKRCLPTDGVDIQTVCDSLTWIDGNTYTESNNKATHKLINQDGCDSVVSLSLSIKHSTSTIDTIVACGSLIWIDGNSYTSSVDSVKYIMTNSVGCDSIVSLNLTINNVNDITTSSNGDTIWSNNDSANYQWLDCDDGYSIISGATKQRFVAKTSGNYAVELSENRCVDTSSCVGITTVEVLENSYQMDVKVYPNPSNGRITIEMWPMVKKPLLSVTDVYGRLVDAEWKMSPERITFSIDEPPGIYFITIQSGERKSVVRLIKK